MNEKYLLLQTRNPTDLVQKEEVRSFALRLGVSIEQVTAVNILTDTLHFDLLTDHHALLLPI